MDFPLTKKAGIVGSAVKVLNHPGTTAAATALSLAPMVGDLISSPAPTPNKRIKPIQSQDGEMTKLQSFPALKCSNLLNLAVNGLAAASSIASLLPGKSQPAAGKAPAGAASFTSNNGTKISAIMDPTGAVDTTGTVEPIERKQAPAPASARTVPKAPMSPGAPKAFKAANLLSMPKFKAGLDTASQLAVIGASALPFYAMYQDNKQQQQDQNLNPAAELRALQSAQATPDLPRKISIASLLPLAPKSSIMSRLNDGVKDFGEGAYNALDHAAEQILTPSMQLDPASHRIPPISHSV